jgi:hypothetical protein
MVTSREMGKTGCDVLRPLATNEEFCDREANPATIPLSAAAVHDRQIPGQIPQDRMV